MLSIKVLNTPISQTSLSDACTVIEDSARQRTGAYVTLVNVHMAVEALLSDPFSSLVNASLLRLPDGLPLNWVSRLKGGSGRQIRGLDLMKELCRRSAETGLKIGLFGSTPAVIERLRAGLRASYPNLQLVYAVAPPYWSDENQERKDMEELGKQLCASGCELLFVGLGCPKQERWMHRYCSSLKITSIGLGAAFDFLAGEKKQAPVWMQRIGLEWLHRLCSEPSRLWRRYAKTNTLFVFFAGIDVILFWLKRMLNSKPS